LSGLLCGLMPLSAQVHSEQNALQSLASEKVLLENQLAKIEADLEKNTSVAGLLEKTEAHAHQIEKNLKRLMSQGAQQNTQKSHNIFVANDSAKKYWLKSWLHEQCQILKNDQQSMRALGKGLASLSQESYALEQKLIEHHHLLHKMTQEQELLQAQMEKHKQQKAADLIWETHAVPLPEVEIEVPTPLSAWNVEALVSPLEDMQARIVKNLFGAFCITAMQSESVRAIYEGTVIFSDPLKGLGNVIMVEHSDGYLSVYGNCDALLKTVGNRVQAQETIALVGHSGQLGQDALYFEVRYQDRTVELPQWFPNRS